MPAKVDSGWDVVASGSPFDDGLTFWGPLKRGESVEWACSNPVTDLSKVDWWAIPIFKARTSIKFERDAKEPRYVAIVGNVVDGLSVAGMFDADQHARDWCLLMFDGKNTKWRVAKLERTVEGV